MLAASVAVVGYAITISGTWFLVRTIYPPSHYSHGILCAAGGSSRTSKILNLPLGDNGVPFRLIVNDLSYILRISSIYAPIYKLEWLVFVCWMFSKMSKSMADTGEIDVIAWLLITILPRYLATFFKKVGQMTGVAQRSALVNEAG